MHYEARFGFARGAIFVGGKPQLYLEGLETDPSLTLLGARSIARVRSEAGGVRFLTLADGQEAVLDVAPQVKLPQGTAVEIDIAAEARHGKLARARLVRETVGEIPRALTAPLTLKDRLLREATALFGADFEADDDADALDAARDEALHPSGPLPAGAYLSVERTRGLIACDVDLSGATGDVRRATQRANEEAAADIARRLRLSGWAGLVVMDLIGRRVDGQRLHDVLRKGFGKTEGVSIAPIGRFGTLEFVCPWRSTPLYDRLHDETGRESAAARAHRLLREAVQRTQGDGGAMLTLKATPDVLSCLQSHLKNSYDPLAPRLRLAAADICEVCA